MCVCFFIYIYIYYNIIFFFFFVSFFFFLYYFLRFSIQHRVSVQWVEYPEEICYIITRTLRFATSIHPRQPISRNRVISRVVEKESSGKPIKKKNLWSHLQKKTKKKERKKERKNKKKQSKII